MKENGYLQLEILKKKEKHILKNIKNLEEKNDKLKSQMRVEEKALSRVRHSIENFGKSTKQETDLQRSSRSSKSDSFLGI